MLAVLGAVAAQYTSVATDMVVWDVEADRDCAGFLPNYCRCHLTSSENVCATGGLLADVTGGCDFPNGDPRRFLLLPDCIDRATLSLICFFVYDFLSCSAEFC